MISESVQDQRVQAVFKRLIEQSQHREPALAAVAAVMLGAVEDNFRAEGRPVKWAPLKVSTLAARAASGKSGKILQATGKLAASITPFHSNDMAGVGTNRPYAAAMHFGSKPHDILPRTKKALAFGGRVVKKVKHPGTVARPFMVLTDRDKADMMNIMGRHIVSGV
jgi:phage virion morphogenesis protein